LNTCYQHSDSDIRGYHGIQLTEDECNTLLVTLVSDNLTDSEEREEMASDLTGLVQTGFSSANLIADIQAMDRIAKSNADIERLVDYVAELEAFKKKEIDRLTCSYCQNVFPTLYHLNSHRSGCEQNPKRGQKQSIFDAVI